METSAEIITDLFISLANIVIFVAIIRTIDKISKRVKENNEILKKIDNYLIQIQQEKQYQQQQNYQNYQNYQNAQNQNNNPFNPYN